MDEEAIAAFRSGRAEAFETLFLKYRDRTFAQAYRMLGDEGLALDAVQETFLALLEILPRWEPRAPIGAWLAEAAWRCSRTQQRKRRLPVPPAPSPPDPKEEEYDRLWEKVGELSPRCREAVLLRFAQGLSLAESAQAMGISEKAVASHLSQAYTALREKIGEKT